MRVLAIDTALEACSAAVLDTELGTIVAHESLPMLRGHAEALLPLIARVMDRAGLEFAALDRIAVTTGPGSFTGLRVGIAAAQAGEAAGSGGDGDAVERGEFETGAAHHPRDQRQQGFGVAA